MKTEAAVLLAGCPEEHADIEYATGFRAPDPVVFMQMGKQRWLVVSLMEQARARAAGRGVTVLTPEDLRVAKSRRRRLADWALALARREGVRRVTVPRDFPFGVALRLQAAGIRVVLHEGEVFPGRAVKTAAEIRCIAEAQQAAVLAMRAAVTAIARAKIDADGGLRADGRPLTSEEVRRRIAAVLIEHDCIGRDTIVAGGAQGADPHARGEGPLRAGEAIVIDIFPRHERHGYWGDLTRTVVRGAPSPRLRRMYRAVRAAQQAALATLRAGVPACRVHRAAAREMDRRGYVTDLSSIPPCGFIHSTGHGVGLAIHESPTLGNADARLKAGSVVTVEPGLYYPGFGGIRIEDTVVVTSDGWRYLVPCEKRFEL